VHQTAGADVNRSLKIVTVEVAVRGKGPDAMNVVEEIRCGFGGATFDAAALARPARPRAVR